MMKTGLLSRWLIAVTFVTVALEGQISASVMALWEFGPGAIYTEEPIVDRTGGATISLTGGEKDLNGKSGVAYVDADGASHPAGIAAAWDNVNSESQIVITVCTSGWQDMVLRFDYFSEATVGDLGPASFDLNYRVGPAGTWRGLLNNQTLTRNDLWHAFSYTNLVLLSQVENQPFVQFRIDDLSAGDESGGTFKIDNIELTGAPLPSSITVVAPNGGENLMAGQPFDIRWQTIGTINTVKLEYSVNGGNGWTEIATMPNMGVLVWDVPDANSLNCLVRVSNALNPAVADVSNGPFRIFECLLQFDLNGDCYIDLRDLALLASEWLLCGDVLDPRCF